MKNFFTYFTNNKNFTLLAIDALAYFEGGQPEELNSFLEEHKGTYRFGFVTYSYQHSQPNKDQKIAFPTTGFFVPKYVVAIETNGKRNYLKGSKDDYSNQRIDAFLASKEQENTNRINLSSRYTKPEYISIIEKLQVDMKNEKVGVVVFCQEFYAEQQEINPLVTYHHLNSKSKAPFSCFLQWGENYLMSASPERFIKKERNKLITQPIKGTAKRGTTKTEDEILKNNLLLSAKEQEENILVVKEIEKELRKIAQEGTVQIDVFSEVNTFETVHQLISTLSAELKPELKFTEILKALFPMGSMTGVPKDKSIALLSKYENFNRGIYSGSVGYIKPNGHFDFNVVIRSIIYDNESKKLVCPVGGGITLLSSPEIEYEECLVKVKALQDTLMHEG